MQRAGMTRWEPDGQHVDNSLLETVENIRRYLSERVERHRRAIVGQFFTPACIARFMAELCEARQPVLRVLDAGAGIGSLSAAFVEVMSRRERRPQAISITAFEIDPRLISSFASSVVIL